MKTSKEESRRMSLIGIKGGLANAKRQKEKYTKEELSEEMRRRKQLGDKRKQDDE